MEAQSMSAVRAEPAAANQEETTTTTTAKMMAACRMEKKKNLHSVNSQQHLTFDTPLLAVCSPPKSATNGNTGLQRELLPLATAVDP